jgi:predicted methyltransferase
MKRVQKMLNNSGASFGAIVSSDVEFVFSRAETSFYSLSSFPDYDQDTLTSNRPIQSKTELEFVINRCLEAHDKLRSGPRHEEEAIDELIESVHLLLESRRTNTDIREAKQTSVSDLYSSIGDRHSWYQKEGELDSALLQATANVFNAYNLFDTDKNVLESFFEISSADRTGSEYSTPIAVARMMVQLAGVQQSEVVLDPAAGRGTLLSIAAEKGGKGSGIEINPAILRLSTFYVDLFDRDINFVVGDFFSPDTINKLDRDNFDKILIDPPMGMNVDAKGIPYTKDRSTLKSEEAFLAKSLSLVSEGGTVTIAVPTGFLTNVRSAWIRELVLDEFTLDSIIQMRDGPLYRHTSIDTAFISVTKAPAPSDHKVKYEVVESPESPTDGLREAVSRIVENQAESIPQVDIEDSFDIQLLKSQRTLESKLENRFPELTVLEDLAKVSAGNPPTDLVSEPDMNTLTYLSISDVSEGDSRHGDRYIFEDETSIVADKSCVLLSALGENTYTFIPSEPLAPAQDLAVIEFSTPEEALVYETFLSSDIGQKQIAAYKSGSRIPRINIRDIRRLKVPKFSNSAITEQAQEIREYRRRV